MKIKIVSNNELEENDVLSIKTAETKEDIKNSIKQEIKNINEKKIKTLS